MEKNELKNYLANISSDAKDMIIFTLVYGTEEDKQMLENMVDEFDIMYRFKRGD